jgi:hypothetical protein
MAVTIPIVSEFDGKGISRAVSEFKSLETVGEKAQFALRKAALPAAAALGALSVAAFAATKAAAEDAKAQTLLAQTLRNSVGATDEMIAANEEFIATTERAAAVADDALRPALGNLVRATGDVTQSQQLLKLALDISAATGRDLESVSIALAKASQGQATALQRLGVPLDEALVKTKDFEGIVSVLTDTFSGSAAAAAETFEGRMQRVSIAIDNTKENIGAALIPVIERLLPYIDKASRFIEENTEIVVIAGGAIAGLAGFILAANTALKLYNITAAITKGLNEALAGSATGAGIGMTNLGTRLGATTLIAWALYESFQNLRAEGGLAFKDLTNRGIEFANLIVAAFEKAAEGINFLLNSMIRAYNLLNPFRDIPLLPTDVNLGRIPMPFDLSGGGTAGDMRIGAIPDRLPSPPRLPSMGGGMMPEDMTGGGGGGGGGARAGGAAIGIDPRALDLPIYQLPNLEDYGRTESARLADLELLNAQPAINVTVNTVTAPADLGQTIVDALIQYNRTSGPIDILVV